MPNPSHNTCKALKYVECSVNTISPGEKNIDVNKCNPWEAPAVCIIESLQFNIIYSRPLMVCILIFLTEKKKEWYRPDEIMLFRFFKVFPNVDVYVFPNQYLTY